MKTLRTAQIGALTIALLGLAACGKKDESKAADTPVAMAPAAPPMAAVSNIETGKHLGPNNRVTEATTTFAPKDTLYLSVVTDNSMPTTTLTAKWMFEGGQLVDSTTQVVARTDMTNPTAVTEFHVVKPSGWPVGKYKVEVWLDGVAAGSRDIEVKK